MEDRDFFDLLYQQFTKTTMAETTFWSSEQATDEADNLLPWWNVWAVERTKDGFHRHAVATDLCEADADFITALHGALPDLVRRLHEAVDKAENLEVERDEQEATIAGLSLEIIELEKRLDDG